LGRKFAAADTSHYNLAKPYDIVYTKSPVSHFPFGIVKQNLNNHNVIVSPLYGVFSPPNKYLGYIIHAYFESSVRTYNFLESIVQKGAKNTILISNETFLSKAIFLPINEQEQQKIADCLSALDGLIAAQSEKVAALKTYKKGLMQNLFPAEGESLPRVRFGEFLSAGGWEEEKLGNLVEIKSGNSPSNYYLSNRGKYPFLKVEDLNNCEKYQVKSREYSNDAENVIPSKSVIFPKRGAAIQLNKVRINVAEVLMDSNLMAITPNKKIQAEFLYYKIVYDGLYKIADASTIPQINNKHIIPYEVVIPSLPEQQRIAELLEAVDEEVHAQGEVLAGLRVHKRGLMQQLFPSMGEVDE
jgi:type I restriction enzyme S subunit